MSVELGMTLNKLCLLPETCQLEEFLNFTAPMGYQLEVIQ